MVMFEADSCAVQSKDIRLQAVVFLHVWLCIYFCLCTRPLHNNGWAMCMRRSVNVLWNLRFHFGACRKKKNKNNKDW